MIQTEEIPNGMFGLFKFGPDQLVLGIVHLIILLRIHTYTVDLQWLEHLWNHEKMFETGLFELMSVNHSARSGCKRGISFRFSLT